MSKKFSVERYGLDDTTRFLYLGRAMLRVQVHHNDNLGRVSVGDFFLPSDRLTLSKTGMVGGIFILERPDTHLSV